MLVDSWLERAAALEPDGQALQSTSGSLTYRELRDRACGAAAGLATLGANPGDRVAIALQAGEEFVIALHACMLLGAVAVPVDLRLGRGERERLTDGALLLDQPLRESSEHAAGYRGAKHDLSSTAVIIHTSGTTSAPKAVELTYGNFLWSALGSAAALDVATEERWLCTLPLSHVGGLSILIRSAIYATTAVVHERFETDRVLRALQDERVTLISLVATTLGRLLDAGLERPPALRCALTGGGPVPAALVARGHAAGVPVSLTYGLSEACSQVSTTPLAETGTATSTAGPPLFCTRVRIAEDQEILVRGPTVAPGALAVDGWLHTGDLGCLDEHGRLGVTGRKADTIVSGGENVAPAEVEAVLEAHPQVLEAAVLGRPDERWGEAVTAWVVPQPGAELDFSDLSAHCAAALAPYKLPKDYLLREQPLPRTRSGKLLRRELS